MRFPYNGIHFDEAAPVNDTKVEEPKLSKPEALNKAIEDAANATKLKLDGEPKKDEPKKEEPKKEEDLKKEEAKKEEELTEEQLRYAKSLFRALANPDPKIQKATIELFAKSAGLELKEIETKKEITEAKDTLLDLLKAGLGEYDFLADKLGPVLEQVIKRAVVENTKDIREEVAQSKQEKLQNHISSSIDTAFAKFTNSVEVKDEVVKLMDSYKKADSVSYDEYFKTLIVVAAHNKGITLKIKGTEKPEVKDEKKIDKNRNDAGTRLSSDRTAEAKEGIKGGSQRKGLDRAVREAAEEALQKMNG